MAYLIAGPLVALVGIVAVFFVLRRKSVEKRSMYSARRSQIEHKVRAARQRTLTPRGRAEHRPAEPVIASPTMAAPSAQPTMTWETPAYSAPPVAPPPPAGVDPAAPSAPLPWETPSAPAPAFDYPAAQPAPAEEAWNPPAPEPFRPAPEPTPMAPSEPSWTPAPAPASEPVAPLAPAASSASGTAAGSSWSVVSSEKESASVGAESDGRKKGGGDTSSWQLASGEAPNDQADDAQVKRPAGNVMALVQYAVLVVGLVMVLIGVMVMVANSHVT